MRQLNREEDLIAGVGKVRPTSFVNPARVGSSLLTINPACIRIYKYFTLACMLPPNAPKDERLFSC